jgi:uncharacterized Zn finger protein (UPF0148 family)
MKIDNHIVNLYPKITRKVPKVNNIEPIRGNMDKDKEIENRHDTVITYCPACQSRLTIDVSHSKAENNQYQLVSIPDHVAMHLEARSIFCAICENTVIIEPLDKRVKEHFFTVKLDCSKMSKGHESWYDNQ